MRGAIVFGSTLIASTFGNVPDHVLVGAVGIIIALFALDIYELLKK